jgi:hypothetical protein
MRITFVDHQTLAKLADRNLLTSIDSPDFEQIREAVNEAIKSLPDEQASIIRMMYFERKTIKQVVTETGLTEIAIDRILRSAKTSLKYRLADFVKNRWPASKPNISTCPICVHPKRAEIDLMITRKPESQNWRKFNLALYAEFGLTVNPPLLIKYHIQYHKEVNYGK